MPNFRRLAGFKRRSVYAEIFSGQPTGRQTMVKGLCRPHGSLGKGRGAAGQGKLVPSFDREFKMDRSRLILVASCVAELTVFFGAAAALAAGMIVLR